MEKISEKESLLLQCLAITCFLAELSNNDFLGSDYFNNLTFANEACKEILIKSGLGNPATMQMMLYALLVVPKEILSGTEYIEFEDHSKKINPLMASLVEEETFSTYDNENSKEKINYIRHIRNSLAHSKCKFTVENYKNYVFFTDSGKNSKQCSIKIECYKVGKVLMELQKLIMEYYNSRHS